MPTLLRGLKAYTSNLTAIVTVADDGGSSGKLRRDLGVLRALDMADRDVVHGHVSNVSITAGGKISAIPPDGEPRASAHLPTADRHFCRPDRRAVERGQRAERGRIGVYRPVALRALSRRG